MDEITDKTIEKIVYLPFEFNHKNKSIYSLLKESGYFELFNRINNDKIVEILRKHPQSIEYWLGWSENRRSDSGWFFTKGEDGQYVVGYYPSKNDIEDIMFTDKFDACATFIKNEVESIRIN